MRTDVNQQNTEIKWQELNPGCVVMGSGTAAEFNTGEWRVDTPVIDMDKCKQCLLCVPVCPDSSIPVKDGKRGDFDYAHCKGCGICVKVCPFGALHLVAGESDAERAKAAVLAQTGKDGE